MFDAIEMKIEYDAQSLYYNSFYDTVSLITEPSLCSKIGYDSELSILQYLIIIMIHL